jgi:hydroxymethylglutaryl-CoA reductase
MTENKSSRLPGFYKKSHGERLSLIKELAGLEESEVRLLEGLNGLDFETANRMIENVIGAMPIPMGVATNFKVNGKEVIVPMAIEEPSVIAAASNAAKLALPEGFESKASAPVMIGQVQIVDIPDMEEALQAIELNKTDLMAMCDRQDSTLIKFGGGTRDLKAKVLESQRGKMLIIHILVDVRDAMGANAVNTMAEAITGRLEEITKGKVRLRIISNLAVHRTVKTKAVWKKDILGEEAIEGILDAYAFAEADPYRCTTHNKGIMNGIDAVILATGNDFRAIESGAHSFAGKDGNYQSLTKYYKNEDGDLVGEIELPMAIGLVGGATRTHPIARVAVKVLGVKTANELAEIIGAVGLAQNFAALRALATEGIQRGHMRLHSKNIAVMAGCPTELIDEVSGKMIESKEINVQKAQEIIEQLTGKKPEGKA